MKVLQFLKFFFLAVPLACTLYFTYLVSHYAKQLLNQIK